MSDRTALYRSILAEPHDDTPRLVYADWLEENGRAEEAEFIRIECRLEHGSHGNPDFALLLDRQAELRMWLSTHAKGPDSKFPARLKVESGGAWWSYTRRGFPRFLEFNGHGRPGLKPIRAMAAALAKAFARVPTRWLVARFITVEQLAELVKQPVIAGLDRLTIQLGVSEEPQNEACRHIARSVHLQNLQGLSLGFPISELGVESLGRSSNFAQLRMLSIDPAQFSPSAARLLAACAWYGKLRELSLSGDCPGESFAELCGQGPLTELSSLELIDNDFPANVWQAFARSRAFPALSDLDLTRSDLSGDRFESFAAARWLQLQGLQLLACAIGNEGSAALASAPWTASLTRLGLGSNLLDTRGVTTMAKSTRFSRLKHLDLGNNAFGAQSLMAIASNPTLRGLTALRLHCRPGNTSGVKAEQMERFLNELKMSELRHLDLSGRPLGHKGARLLAQEKFQSLTRLELAGCKLTDTAVASLLAAPALQNLIELDLTNNGLKTGVSALTDRQVLPQLSRGCLELNPIPPELARKLRRRPGLFL